MDWVAIEAKIILDIQTAPASVAASLQKLKDLIGDVKGNAFAEGLLEKLWPGVVNFEAEALKDLDFLSHLTSEVIGWLNILFPKKV